MACDRAYFVAGGARVLGLVTPEGVEETGAHPTPDSLRASPDGRYLLFLDPVSGEPGPYDDPLMQAVVVDLERGEEIVRTSEQMGDPATDDLRDLYEDAPPATLGITDDTAYVLSPSDVVTLGLADGKVTADDVETSSPRPSPGPGPATRTT